MIAVDIFHIKVFLYARYAAFGLVGLMAVVWVVTEIWMNTQRKHTSGVTVGIIGRKGQGKSYAAVRMALERMQKGVDVYSNFMIDTEALGLKGKWYRFQGWEQFSQIRNAVVIIDEAYMYAPSSQHLHFPMVARIALAQSRKNGIDLYWLCQHEDRINKTLLHLTDQLVLTERFFGNSFFVLKSWEPEEFRKPKKHLSRRIYRFKMSIAQHFDTMELLEPDEYALKGDASAAAIRRLQAQRAPGEPASTARTLPMEGHVDKQGDVA